MGNIKIGFPRALFYYAYYPFWYAFFSELGFEVVASSPTTKYSLDLGVQETVNDACLPIKLYHGHVAELKDKVDIIFMPRMVRVRKMETEVFCPKFLGLPDMIRNSIEGLPRIIDERVDLSKGLFPVWKLCQSVAKQLDKSGVIVWRSYKKARRCQNEFHRYLVRGIPVEEAINAVVTGQSCQKKEEYETDIDLAILGYPYLIYDSFVNVGLFDKLGEMGIKPWTVEMVPPERLEKQGKYLSKSLFWHFSNRTIRSTLYYLHEKKVDGIIHVTAFGCGPDAMVDKLMELETKNTGKLPFMTLSLDELTGEAGILTRIEAFVDMLRLRRKKNENSISHHG
ncbi:MAG: acyl-CoA dehydratase activase-related protein [Clostridia bacterium]|nr:acyl-CoA dehydratase activase-related protein [Clostridia bacterium]MDD4048937.1 acyl-CoA dehydratase activase-related protein [Clostridia bacterium]